MVKPGQHSGFVYRDALWHGADMVGTGVASFSHVGGIHFQNLDGWEEYLSSIDRGALPLSRALPASDRQQLIRQLILQLKLGRLDTRYFQDTFGVDVRAEFADAFAEIARDGYGKIEGAEVRLNREGLLRVDGLLPLFFEPEFHNIRYT
jgi:oxygen-independent coproporphyrinogen-3 oxidase